MISETWALAAIRDHFDAINRRDWFALKQVHHPDTVYITPVNRCVGREQLLRRWEELVHAVPDVHFTDVQLVGLDQGESLAVIEYTQTGTVIADIHTHDGGIIAPSARPFSLRTTATFSFDGDGLIVAWRSSANDYVPQINAA